MAVGCLQVPHLPRKWQLDVSKCHACHANGRWMSPSATPATQSAAASPRNQSGPSAPPDPAQCLQCHTCHANGSWMSPSATPATQMAGGCRRVPHLQRKVPRCHRVTNPVQARRQTLPSVSSATPATQMAVGCLQVPRLPHKWQVDVPECHTCHAKCRGVTARPIIRSKRATRPSPVPYKRHACHAK